MSILLVISIIFVAAIAVLVLGIALGRALAAPASTSTSTSTYDAIVTELKEELDTLNAAHEAVLERYQLLTDNLVAAVIMRDQEGHTTYCSPFTEVLTGYSVAEIYEHPGDFFLSILHPADTDKYERALKVVASGEPFQVRHRFFHKTGLEMWAETRSVPVADVSGEVAFSLSIMLDVTGAVRYQHQVEQRNRDIQEFTTIVSHDLKAPINTIKGMLNVIREDFDGKVPAELAKVLTHIHDAAGRLEQLVASILEYARISTKETEFKPVSIGDVFRQIQNDFGAALREAHGTLLLPTNAPIVIGDQTWLYQVFSNLVGNALKYKSDSRPPRIEITVEHSPTIRTAVVQVKDNGCGVPENELDNIFRPFQRVHRDKEGFGIGLASVRKITERLGGSVSVMSTVDQGSTFSVTLRTP